MNIFIHVSHNIFNFNGILNTGLYSTFKCFIYLYNILQFKKNLQGKSKIDVDLKYTI